MRKKGSPLLYKLLYMLGVLEIEGNLQCNEGVVSRVEKGEIKMFCILQYQRS
jgi:hypothetical protein